MSGVMVERVAAVLSKAEDEWSAKSGLGLYEYMARAAIEAMREPTFEPDRVSYHAGMSRRDWWAAMIDAALAEGEKG